MPTKLVNAHKFRKILFETPPPRKRVEVEIEASNPIDIYVVQKSDLEEWKSGEDYGGMSFQGKKKLTFQFRVERDFDDEWYLILENDSDIAVAVHYEVYDI